MLDFFCDAAKLAIEIDGAGHQHTVARDVARDEWLRAQGVEVFRMAAGDVLASPDDAARTILAEIQRRLDAPPQGELSRSD